MKAPKWSAPLTSGLHYDSRNYILRRMGFNSYGDYLASSLWRRVRAKVFRIRGRVCLICGSQADQVHHNRYHEDDLTGRTVAFLTPLCRSCHERAEFTDEGRKVTLSEAKSAVKGARRKTYHGLDEVDRIKAKVRRLLDENAPGRRSSSPSGRSPEAPAQGTRPT